jgi:hypothetical protein
VLTLPVSDIVLPCFYGQVDLVRMEGKLAGVQEQLAHVTREVALFRQFRTETNEEIKHLNQIVDAKDVSWTRRRIWTLV